MTFPVRGVRAGHWTGVRTGTTVLLFPSGSVGSGEVRGGAPATREVALLDPLCTVERVDAIVLTGGSAFGLAAADGVMRFLAERGQGFATGAGPVPIVPTAAVFDLMEAGDERPGAFEGYAAAVAAERDGDLATGAFGAGRSATIGKWRGRDHRAPGGVGFASARVDDATVAAVVVANALGDVIGADGLMLAGSNAPPDVVGFPTLDAFGERENTTLAAVVTDAALDKSACHLLARSAHDGFARALRPAHTRFDGDVCFAVSTGAVRGHLDRLREAAAATVADATRDAARAGSRTTDDR
ncbi:MAG: putative S58-family peptidase [Actinomycetia bacterium]|nr:putative S58-family peptidase [Actinomycetes bacterium]